MNRKKESKVVPNVRFKGFTDDWKQRKLGEVCLRVQGNDGRMDLPTLTISASNGWMNQEDRFSGNIAGKEQKNYTLLHKGELSYNHGNSKLAKYGTVFSLQSYKEALVPRVYHSFKVEKGSPDFIEYYFATKLPDRELGKLISSGARMDGLLNIGYNEFMGIQMLFPSVEEQKQISNYFRSLDHLITLHQQKITLLTKLKKAMLEKMFPKKGSVIPEFRFNGFANAWEQRKLGDIADVTKLAGFEFTEHVVYSDEGNIIALRGLNIKNGQLILDDVKYIDGSNFSKLSRSKLFINDIMFTYVGTVGEVAIIKEDDRFYLAPNVSRIRVKSDDSPKFISHYMRTDNFKNKVIFPLIATSSQPALSMENIRKFTINIPINREEQDYLAKYFDSLDHLINLHQRKIDMLKNMKKAMLDQMFI